MATKGAMVEPFSQGISGQVALMKEDREWTGILGSWLSRKDAAVSLVGVGNPIRRDNGVGLEIAAGLRRLLGPHPAPGVSIPRPTRNPERLVSEIAHRRDAMVIFDAVEASRPPGTIVCAPLGSTKYGLFATHNVPLKVFPAVAANVDRMLMVGVQPYDLEVGEGLSHIASNARDQVVREVAGLIGGGRPRT